MMCNIMYCQCHENNHGVLKANILKELKLIYYLGLDAFQLYF